METDPSLFAISTVLVLVVSVLLVITGLKKQPGIGIITSAVIIAVAIWLRKEGLGGIGFEPPESWGRTLFSGLVLGLVIQLLSVALFEPLSEKITNTRHNHSVVANVKGNWKALAQWLVVVWLLVAFLEEFVYRGFLMTEIAKVIGVGVGSLIFNILFTSIIFGLSHGYQESCGILSTGVVGVLLAVIFVWSDFNLWLVIFTHGFIDTVGIGLIAMDADQLIRLRIWKA